MSKAFRMVRFALAAIVATSAPALATDLDSFTKLLAKVAPPITAKFKPRVACACPPVNGIMRAGYLASDPISTNIYCAEPAFNPDGSLEATCRSSCASQNGCADDCSAP
jgi:hypothetical protein